MDFLNNSQPVRADLRMHLYLRRPLSAQAELSSHPSIVMKPIWPRAFSRSSGFVPASHISITPKENHNSQREVSLARLPPT